MYRLRTSSAVEFMCAPSHLTKCPAGISRFGSPSDAASLFCPLLLPSESFSSWNRWSHSHSLFFFSFFFSYIKYYTQEWFLLLMASKSTSIQSQNRQVRRRLSKKKGKKTGLLIASFLMLCANGYFMDFTIGRPTGPRSFSCGTSAFGVLYSPLSLSQLR